MTRKPQINDAEPHVVTSHGADFFGEDRHPLKALVSLAGYAEGCLSRDERGPLVLLLTNPGEGGTMSPSQAAEIAQLLLKLARHRFVKPSAAAHAHALGSAAARAAADGEPWEWRVETEAAAAI
ncbi:hypothetical protein [Streptomyces sp. FL07-04A]|uniref:DUF7739 domain-containing protein n=1 Tax=Streptomyces sp. FL07-04A TaxID=3028658 RepID=UPI0029BA27B4|nr:hypothetical protein [Streptomyces sp. FL07-04A]MDX3579948.1 hypothetical protein [Streptomyces sp. FL07-04A]